MTQIIYDRAYKYDLSDIKLREMRLAFAHRSARQRASCGISVWRRTCAFADPLPRLAEHLSSLSSFVRRFNLRHSFRRSFLCTASKAPVSPSAYVPRVHPRRNGGSSPAPSSAGTTLAGTLRRPPGRWRGSASAAAFPAVACCFHAAVVGGTVGLAGLV